MAERMVRAEEDGFRREGKRIYYIKKEEEEDKKAY
jgi:hypothetical protein